MRRFRQTDERNPRFADAESRMPIVDGCDITHAIRDHRHPDQRIVRALPVVAQVRNR